MGEDAHYDKGGTFPFLVMLNDEVPSPNIVGMLISSFFVFTRAVVSFIGVQLECCCRNRVWVRYGEDSSSQEPQKHGGEHYSYSASGVVYAGLILVHTSSRKRVSNVACTHVGYPYLSRQRKWCACHHFSKGRGFCSTERCGPSLTMSIQKTLPAVHVRGIQA